MLGGVFFRDALDVPAGVVDGSSGEGWWLRRVNKVSEPRLFELRLGGVGGMDRFGAMDDFRGGYWADAIGGLDTVIVSCLGGLSESLGTLTVGVCFRLWFDVRGVGTAGFSSVSVSF